MSESRYGDLLPMAEVDMIIWSTAPDSTTLVSPVAMGTPASVAVLPMESMTLSTMSMSKPSSMTTEHASARGVAPMTEMSLTVPATEILPMSPPGKNRGFTVCPSMVNTTSSTTAESSIESSGTSAPIFGKCFVIWSPRNCCISSPPAPWFMITLAMGRESVRRDIHFIQRPRNHFNPRS